MSDQYNEVFNKLAEALQLAQQHCVIESCQFHVRFLLDGDCNKLLVLRGEDSGPDKLVLEKIETGFAAE